MKIKFIKIEQLQVYCDLWAQNKGDEVRGLYLALSNGLYIAVDSSEKLKSDPYWQEEFESFSEAIKWLKSASE